MSTSRKTVIGGLVGVIVAIGLIVAGAYAFGGLGVNGGTSSINSMTTQSISASSSGGSSGSTGTLQISMIDPPNVPANVVDVYINYSAIQIHVTNSTTNSGWFNVTQSGSLNLTSIITTAEVFPSVTLPTGTYNIIRFNVTGAIVTVLNSTDQTLKNYTASVPAGMIQSVITGGVKVQSSNPAGLLVDITPTVHEVNGSYTLLPSATSHPQTPVGNGPAAATNSSHKHTSATSGTA